MRSTWLLIPLFAGLLPVLTLGCGEDSGKSPGAPGVAAPLPSPSPSGGLPGERPGWSSLTELRVCPFPECPAAAGFTVFRSGSYSSGLGASGFLSGAELEALRLLADAVAGSDLAAPRQCVPFEMVPGRSTFRLDLTRDDGQMIRVYEDNAVTSQTCVRGDPVQVQALLNEVDELAQRYDLMGTGAAPQSPGSPAPSPTPAAR